MTKTNRKTKKRTCKIYKSCQHVPCNQVMEGCEPAYCTHGSKNWALCNMANWNPKYQKYCEGEENCKMRKRIKISKDQVYAKELHNKMPYIWRHLDNKTRRKMVRLARKPVSVLNIKYIQNNPL